MKGILTKSLVALGLVAGMASTAMAQQGVSDTEIVIGSNGDLSGVFAPFNVQAIKALQQTFDEVNAAGGIHGRKIRFIVEDHGYQVPKAVQNFNKLVNSDRVFVMVSNLGTPHNLAGFPIMEAAKVANVSPLSAARQMIEGDTTYKYTGGSSYYDQLKAAIEYLSKETGAKEICSMYFPSDFGLEVYEGTKEKAEELGLSYAAETTHKPDDQDFVGSLTKLREAGCDIVSTAVGVRQTIVILGTAKKLGWNDVAFVGSSAGFNTAVAKVPGGVTEGYYAAASWSDLENRLATNEELRKWAEGFKAATGEDPGTAAQLGRSAGVTLVKALEAAGKDLTPESFQKGMESLAFHDPIADGDIKYGPGDHQGGDVIVINKIEGGVWKEVGRVDPTKSQ
ncbi:MAG: ABC transporter substrate-binding protein [Rhizobiaceae bacterium]